MHRVEGQFSAIPEPALPPAVADVLSAVLKDVRLDGAARFHCEFSEPWGLQAGTSPMGEFHLIVSGAGWMQWSGARASTRFEAGDLIVFPHGDAHALFSPFDAPRTPVGEVVRRHGLENFGPVVLGGGGERTEVICGFFRALSDRPHPLIQGLPGLIHLRHSDARDAVWLRSAVNLLSHEIKGFPQGAHAVMNRLVEILFIHAVRAHASMSRQEPGFFAALSDRHIGNALKLMHARLSEPWTLESLAHAVALSRAAFAVRFHRLVREAPMTYLTRRRMERGQELLATAGLSVAQVAEQVGYGSEAAFARAFKKATGRSPGEVRRTA